ncbi:hypothetical protein KFL_005040030 [Klebsormidium nitens]|uniref:SCP domain-containing protein n=1 Tax=Klebsormidium nitens TaxID=105231 RepID=A0A1Y1IIH0_KLENI|nr:hypothetical protein KFL_005040030 [Klebsormidium nitens]|eukprot:GAQ89259.1 hypothetical protein KFL_005040030 [Klebsormidium nitens]
MGKTAAPSFWASSLVGCLLLSSLLLAEAGRHNSGLANKGREHSHHHHHGGHGHGKPVGISTEAEFEGDVLPEKTAVAQGSGKIAGGKSENNRRSVEESADVGGVYMYLASFLTLQSRPAIASMTGVTPTNCHLSHDVTCGNGKQSGDRLGAAVDFLTASLFGKSTEGKQILPADESAKPAEIDPAPGFSQAPLERPSDAGKKILPSHEGTKPAELDPANHKQGGEIAGQETPLPADEGTGNPSWTGLLPSIVRAFASIRNSGHVTADISGASALRRPSDAGKQILPADEGRGVQPPQSGMEGERTELNAAFSETRARMLISAGSPETSTVSQLFLDAHNAARSAVGVQPIKWNTTLAIFAQAWANNQKINASCAMAHRPTSGPNKRIYGENIAWNGGFKSSATQITNLWAGESIYYNRTSNTCTPGKVCGHYTAIVWAKTTQLGCAVVACPDPTYRMTQFWVCNYWPNGNIIGQRPY